MLPGSCSTGRPKMLIMRAVMSMYGSDTTASPVRCSVTGSRANGALISTDDTYCELSAQGEGHAAQSLCGPEGTPQGGRSLAT